MLGRFLRVVVEKTKCTKSWIGLDFGWIAGAVRWIAVGSGGGGVELWLDRLSANVSGAVLMVSQNPLLS